MKILSRIYLYALPALLSVSCSSWYPSSVSGHYYNIDTLASDSGTLALIIPYRSRIDSTMNQVVGILPFDLKKEKPNGNLGFWMADACRTYPHTSMGRKVDLAFLNHGGIRRPYLREGNVVLGDLYELMPFDNQLVYMEVKGSFVLRICQLVVDKGGEPVSGVEIRKDGSNMRVLIGGEKLDPDKTYSMITNDYMYSGGDGYGLLKETAQVEYMGLVRDALIYEMRRGKLAFAGPEERRIYLD